MGKYSTVIAGLTPAPVDDHGYQSKIDKIKADIKSSGLNVEGLAKNYADARAEKGELTIRLNVVNELLEAYAQLLCESCEAGEPGWGTHGAKENAIRLPNGGVIRIDKEPMGKVVDKEQFRLWCIENGLERSLQLWPSTMNTITKERLLAGAPAPDGVDVHFWEKVVYTKP